MQFLLLIAFSCYERQVLHSCRSLAVREGQELAAVLGHLKRALSQLFPVALGLFADKCLPRVQGQYHQVSH